MNVTDLSLVPMVLARYQDFDFYINTAVRVFLPFELLHVKTNKMTCVPSEDSDQPGHLPSLIRVFAVRSMCS